MNIQSLNGNVFAGAVPQRQQSNSQGTVASATVQTNETVAAIQSQPQVHPEESSNREKLASAVSAANDFVSTVNNSVQFRIDDETGTSIVRVVDRQTNELIRQIPSEEMLAIAKALDTIKGLLVQQKA